MATEEKLTEEMIMIEQLRVHISKFTEYIGQNRNKAAIRAIQANVLIRELKERGIEIPDELKDGVAKVKEFGSN